MSDQIRVNGACHSWGSIVVKIDGDQFYGFTDISFADKLETTPLYGLGPGHYPRGRSRGKYSCEASKLKGPKSTIAALITALAGKSVSGKSVGLVEFTVTCTFVEGEETPIVVELMQCRLTSLSSSHSESPDPLMDEIEIQPLFLKRNGLTLYEA